MPRRNDLSIYDREAPHWWSGKRAWLGHLHNLVPARFACFDPVVGAWAGKRVLDLGCGGGFMAEALARRGARVVGVDPSGPALEAARAHAREGGLAIEYVAGRGESIPLADASVDVAVCVDVLEHVANLDATLSEVARVLVPGGLFLFDTINRTPLATLVMIRLAEDLLRLVPRGTHDPALFIRPGDLRARLESRGFEVGPFVGIGPTGFDRRFRLRFAPMRSTLVEYAGYGVRHPSHNSVTEDPRRALPPPVG